MIDNSGDPLTPGWSLNGSGVYISQKNLMTANIQGNAVELVVRNADPVGRAAGATLGFTPRVTVGGVVVTPSAPTLLATDPDNSGFNENVLEWNYGTFTRRLRQVQGRVTGKWIFPANPGGDVRITYNQTGDYRLKLGEYAANADEEFIPESVFLDAGTVYPFTVGDSTTFYPDADAESTSVDGGVARSVYYIDSSGVSWAGIRDGAGTVAGGSTYDMSTSMLQTSGNDGTYWLYLFRGIVLFDTSGIDDGHTVTAATLSLYNVNALATGTWAGGGTNVYLSTPASNTSLETADYGRIGTVAQSTTLTQASGISVDAYNDFALNDMSQISVDGITKLGIREAAYDAEDVELGHYTSRRLKIEWRTAEMGGVYRPKLVVTHAAPATGKGFFGMM